MWVGRKEMFILFTVIWCRTYGKGPVRERERKPAAATMWLLFPISSKGSFIHRLDSTYQKTPNQNTIKKQKKPNNNNKDQQTNPF